MQRVVRRICLGPLLTAISAVSVFAQKALTWQEVRDKFEAANPTLRAGQVGIDESRAQEITHGEHKFEKEEKEENFRRVERQYGSFTRSFTLPSSVDPGQVSANYDKGVLKINLAKKAEAKPKQIKVNVGSEKAIEAKVHDKAA
jgi:HSP20 family protein